MLIQNVLSKSLEENIDAGQFFWHAFAAVAFNDLEFPKIFVEQLHAKFEGHPHTEEEMLRLLAVVGFGAVVRYAKEQNLDERFIVK